MKRYSFLNDDDIYTAFSKLRNAFLAAQNGDEVDKILDGLLTFDEKIKIGRRILVAESIVAGIGVDEICSQLSVGKNTISSVSRALDANFDWYTLIEKRRKTVEKEYKKHSHREVGGSLLVHKKKVYTGFKRKDVKR